MARRSDLVDLYKDVLGSTPATLVKTGHQVTAAQLSALIGEYAQAPSGEIGTHRDPFEIWPLVSHHTHGSRGLFGTNSRSLLPRTLTMLLIHDGLVVADPLQDVLRDWTEGHRDKALRRLQRTTEELAQVEGLLTHGVLRLTQMRPALQDTSRAVVLEAFGLTPEMRVFTNFAEAAVALPDLPASFDQRYVAEARELFGRFGLPFPAGEDSKAASERVKALAAAVIEVTWQVAVAANDPGCDIAVRGRLEQHLAEAIIATGLNADLASGRHFSRLALGEVPNLDAASLSVADALAIRRGDAFEAFRSSLRVGLDRLDADTSSGRQDYLAIASFEEAMRDSAVRLREQVSRASFKDTVISGGISAAIGAVPGFAGLTVDPALGATAGAATSLTALVVQWLYGRRRPSGSRVAERYLAMLAGGSRMTD
ncbi:hypothetical protein M3C61_08020 [Dermacoccus abyssi]|uniref:hypothetical protein n=1 Tax=Dermacoccus abyssi TaxID=322596 RepID=UPI0021A7B823|nr:hypothetical protein [Dermacoccus abyssi]MCT1986959.1 hypothetical protein [Dermacoccus abyssi]